MKGGSGCIQNYLVNEKKRTRVYVEEFLTGFVKSI